MLSRENTKILIVDENPAIISAFSKFLRIKGFSIDSKNSILKGVKHLENKQYHVVFTDLKFENFTKQQIFTIIQEHKIFEKTTVCFLSSIDLSSIEVDQWKQLGLYSYLKKPVKGTVIVNLLDEIRSKSILSDKNIEPEPEATSEQLARLEQLEKQIQELESQPEPEPEPTPEPEPEATSEQLARLEQLEKQIQELESQPEPEPEPTPEPEPEATSEQLARLEQLEKQIQELEPTLNLKSILEINSKNIDENDSLHKELLETSQEISKLKNQIESLDQIVSTSFKSNSSLTSTKKSTAKTKKKSDSTPKKSTAKTKKKSDSTPKKSTAKTKKKSDSTPKKSTAKTKKKSDSTPKKSTAKTKKKSDSTPKKSTAKTKKKSDSTPKKKN